jgi:ATP-dependent protease ClpP protease subunit
MNCKPINGIMLYLNSENKSKNICIYINSPGGSVTCGLVFMMP